MNAKGLSAHDEDLASHGWAAAAIDPPYIATRPGYRTPKTVLLRLRRRLMIFGYPGSQRERRHSFDLPPADDGTGSRQAIGDQEGARSATPFYRVST